MRDIILFILLYLVWNSPVHAAHPTAVPVLLTLAVVSFLLELVIGIAKKTS